jgi:hypothetical protein
VLAIERLSISFDVRTGLSMRGPSPETNSSFKPMGSTGNSRSAKMMAASMPNRRTGCNVASAAKTGFRQKSTKSRACARNARYSGR